jgi:hypothetical protein
MESLLEHPAAQAGLAPLVAALIVALALRGSRAAWLAVTAAYVTMVSLTTGFLFVPLSASRKVALLVLLVPAAGLLLDRLGTRRGTVAVVSAVAAALAVWAFASVLVQRESAAALGAGLGVAVFAGGLVWLVLRLRDDGPALAATGVGLGLAAGVSALLSASIGYFMSGLALAAGAGALLLLQALRAAPLPGGFVGALTIGVSAALFGGASTMLAQLPGYALPLFWLVPLAVSLPIAAGAGGASSTRIRAAALGLAAVVAAVAPVAAAWFAARASAG